MLTHHFSPFPILVTDRMALRQLTLDDVDEMYLYRSDKELMRYIPRRLATCKEDAIDLINLINHRINEGLGINWAITLKGDDKMIGTIGFVGLLNDNYRAEVGYLLHTPYHGTGLMLEALNAVLDYGFKTMKLHSIEAVVNPENIPSSKLLEKAGFTKDAYFKEYQHHNGKFIDALVYSLITKEMP